MQGVKSCLNAVFLGKIIEQNSTVKNSSVIET